MDSVEQVMKGLTKAQRTALIWRVQESARWGVGIPVLVDRRVRWGLCVRKLTHDYLGFGRLTPLGLEVRARLLSSGGEG